MARIIMKKKKNRVSFRLQTGAEKKICLVLSLLLHVLILMAIQKAFPVNWLPKQLKTFRVELYRPPIDPDDSGSDSKTDLAPIEAEKPSQSKVTQDTISLDTKDKRYVPYARLVKERLMQNWKYPEEALDKLIEGKLLALFSLDRQGNLLEVKIVQISGFEILDKEAVRAIRASAAFPPFPSSVIVSRLNIEASFDYRLTSPSHTQNGN